MRYTPRDLRAADMFALILVGVGVAMLAIGVIQFSLADSTVQANDSSMSKSVVVVKPKGIIGVPGLRLGIAGFVFTCLGAALCFKVRQLTRTGGVEPSEYCERDD